MPKLKAVVVKPPKILSVDFVVKLHRALTGETREPTVQERAEIEAALKQTDMKRPSERLVPRPEGW